MLLLKIALWMCVYVAPLFDVLEQSHSVLPPEGSKAITDYGKTDRQLLCSAARGLPEL